MTHGELIDYLGGELAALVDHDGSESAVRRT
jgi:hypothetical protein